MKLYNTGISTLKSNYRFEKKIPLTLESLQKLRYWFKANGYNFKELYSPRIINNIYFDSPLLSNYDENLAGVSERSKCRLRWYCNHDNIKHSSGLRIIKFSFIEPDNLRFEIKLRKNMVGSKNIQPLDVKTFQINPIPTLYKRLRKEIKPKYKVILDRMHQPCIFNQYKREYYAFENVRITIDTDIKYSNIQNKLPTSLERSTIEAVMEIKLPIDQLDKANNIIAALPFRPDKNSKYVDAIETTSYYLYS